MFILRDASLFRASPCLLRRSGIVEIDFEALGCEGRTGRTGLCIMKLNAYIAHAGICSRRKAVALVMSGVVTVNNFVVTDPAHEVRPQDLVAVSKKPVKVEEKVYIMLNKPKGVVTTAADERGRETVIDLLGPSIKERVYPIGRLDKDTTGLLILTNDGALAQLLAHPRYEVSKTYQITISTDIADADIERIKKGVYLEDGRAKVDAVSFCAPGFRRALRIVIHSGKKRVIRRLFESLGYQVKSLHRIAYAGLTLKGLAAGSWRHLIKQEIGKLFQKK